ncbi:DUF4262 domain-containing protein [Polyangium sorediatum]|uniref:DUF4262 domain-containing protein n=1 Tax=Polyangium sorediatum TaxID=889274 RepID=UPI0010BD5B91
MPRQVSRRLLLRTNPDVKRRNTRCTLSARPHAPGSAAQPSMRRGSIVHEWFLLLRLAGTGMIDSDVLENRDVRFVTMKTDEYRAHLGYAFWFYHGVEFPVLQVVWPDGAGRFPWDPACRHGPPRSRPGFRPSDDSGSPVAVATRAFDAGVATAATLGPTIRWRLIG